MQRSQQMPTKKDNSRIYTILSTAGSAFILIVILFCIFTEVDLKNSFKHNIDLTTMTGWTFNGEAVGAFPYRYKVSPGEVVVLENTIPEDIGDDLYMTFRALYSATEVFVDGESIYKYGDQKLLPFGHITGNIRLLVPIDQNMAGKTVTIRMKAFYSLNCDYYDIEFGHQGDIKTAIFYDNLFRIVIVSVMAAIFFASIGIGIANALERSLLNTRLLINFACFVLLIAAWITCSSDIPQILGHANTAASLISFMALSLLGVPYSGFCEQLLTKGKKFFYYSKMIAWGLPTVTMVAYIFGFFDPPSALFFIHLSIFIIASASLVFAVLDRNSNKTAKVLLGAFLELIVFVAIGFACFYFAPSMGYDATVFGVGLLLFMCILFGLIIARQVSSIEERKYVEIYKELAYSDILTGLGNRAGFDRDFSKLLEYKEKGTRFTLFMLDINFLKETNDTFGHQEGDRIITSLSECMRKVFEDLGKCYRLGGDEFAVICTDLKKDPEEILKTFDAEIENFNKTHERKLSSARGFADLEWNGESDFFTKLFKIADQKMYDDKQLKHLKKWDEAKP